MSPKMKAFAVGTLLFMTQRGVMMFQLPTIVSLEYGTNGWIIIIFLFALVLLHLWGIHYGIKKHDYKSVLQLISERLPKPIAFMLHTVAMLIFVAATFTFIHTYVSTLQYTNDISVPINSMAVILLGVCVYTAWQGSYTIAKVSIVFFLLSFWTIGLEVLQFSDFSTARLTPFFFHNANPTVQGFFQVFSAFFGFEILMILAPHLDKKTAWFRSTLIFNCILGAYYLMYCLLVQGLLPINQSSFVRLAVLRLYGSTQITILSYITDLLFIFLMFSTAINTSIFIWCAAQMLKQMQKVERKAANYTLIGLLSTALILAPVSMTIKDSVKSMVVIADWVLMATWILLYMFLPKQAKNKQSTTKQAELPITTVACGLTPEQQNVQTYRNKEHPEVI
ncbi:GerAB/ArcD/ProY family transporter [Paenibacillus sp. 481]|uniref:GerAB/ArcD/ProY family transporter n=1 Tax=Paenibacillus sp. 481 TaxID=2835869 RepID=UPI001E54CBBA|nr:GerAB/ArcD/ProY family transporter [Paenibacillus sp. 481]UHA72575.1 GerAB/ArcD/ProY family transporter [Paenibacillus sp. 481]